QDQVSDEEAEEIRGLRSGLGLGGGFPSEGDEPSGKIRNGPAQVEPCGGGDIVVQVDPVTDEGCDRADQHEERQAQQQTASAGNAGELQARQSCDQEE